MLHRTSAYMILTFHSLTKSIPLEQDLLICFYQRTSISLKYFQRKNQTGLEQLEIIHFALHFGSQKISCSLFVTAGITHLPRCEAQASRAFLSFRHWLRNSWKFWLDFAICSCIWLTIGLGKQPYRLSPSLQAASNLFCPSLIESSTPCEMKEYCLNT